MTDGPAAATEVWAEAMLAAALLAVDPDLGGAVLRAGPGAAREAWLTGFRGLLEPDVAWRRLPPGIGDERLLGGLDLAAALGSGRRVLQRGLLAEADGGVVIAPMAERLGAGTAARLAGALDDGAVTVERDGMTERLDARIVLVALDEGVGAEERVPEAISERLAFHIDLDGVGHREALPISATPEDIAEARAALGRVDAGPSAGAQGRVRAGGAGGARDDRRGRSERGGADGAGPSRDAGSGDGAWTAARSVRGRGCSRSRQ